MPTCTTVLLKYYQHASRPVRMLLITATPLSHMTARQIICLRFLFQELEEYIRRNTWMQEQMSGVGLLCVAEHELHSAFLLRYYLLYLLYRIH